MPLRGPQLAYYLKKKDPQLYEKAKTIKEKYDLTWDKAIKIARGELPEPIKSDLASELENLKAEIQKLKEALNWIQIGLKFKVESCRYVDSDGYCKYYNWLNRGEGWKVKEEDIGGRIVYRVNVYEHKFLCLGCPKYKPKRGI
jgi:hypothetical protein